LVSHPFFAYVSHFVFLIFFCNLNIEVHLAYFVKAVIFFLQPLLV